MKTADGRAPSKGTHTQEPRKEDSILPLCTSCGKTSETASLTCPDCREEMLRSTALISPIAPKKGVCLSGKYKAALLKSLA